MFSILAIALPNFVNNASAPSSISLKISARIRAVMLISKSGDTKITKIIFFKILFAIVSIVCLGAFLYVPNLFLGTFSGSHLSYAGARAIR